MTDRPIIFSAPMVRALLDGRKTQTRRVLKPQPPERPAPNCHPSHTQKHPEPYLDAYCGEKATAANPRGMSRDWHWWQVDDRLGPIACRAPCAPGDRLWVKEAWCLDGQMNGIPPSRCSPYEPVGYPADGSIRELSCAMISRGRLRSPIHMPRWASRLTLLVTDVRVQRLQEISEADAVAEGINGPAVCNEGYDCPYGPHGGCCGNGYEDARSGFCDLWNSIHGPEAWDANPWVCAVSFRTERKNIDAMGGEPVNSGDL